MASTQHDDNCLNCEDRRKESTDPDCVECIENSIKGAIFPNWKPINKTA